MDLSEDGSQKIEFRTPQELGRDIMGFSWLLERSDNWKSAVEA
jgi:hypothetical protein